MQFASKYSKLYTHAHFGGIGMDDPRRAKVGRLVRGLAKTPHLGDAFVPTLGPMQHRVHAVAEIMYLAGRSALAEHKSGVNRQAGRSSFIRLSMRKGKRSDWHINLEAVAPPGAFGRTKTSMVNRKAALLSAEFGAAGWTDRNGVKHPAQQGMHVLDRALMAGWAAVGGFG